MTKRPKDWVRLACVECERDDCDGITPEQLGKLVADGKWGGVHRIQSWWESMDVEHCDDHGEWWTHLGYCTTCLMDEVTSDPSSEDQRKKKFMALFRGLTKCSIQH